MQRDNQLRNTRFKINKNWRVDMREPLAAGRRPYLVVIGEFVHKYGVIDYPIHYNIAPNSIAYDCPEVIPQFVKDKVAALYERFPILKRENKPS
jgi:hypothetical protein